MKHQHPISILRAHHFGFAGWALALFTFVGVTAGLRAHPGHGLHEADAQHVLTNADHLALVLGVGTLVWLVVRRSRKGPDSAPKLQRIRVRSRRDGQRPTP